MKHRSPRHIQALSSMQDVTAMNNFADKAHKRLASGLPVPASPGTKYFGRKDSDRYYQLPLWVIKFGIYLKLTKHEIKLYLFFAWALTRFDPPLLTKTDPPVVKKFDLL